MSEKIDCPVDACDYSGNNRGLGIHAPHEHPDMDIDTSSKKKYTCEYCGDTFTDYPSRRETRGRENFFCSRECKDNFSSKDGLDTECLECGEKVHIPKSRIDEVNGYEQKNYFCSKKCESSFKSREWVGEGHPSWDGGREQMYCEECGNRYLVSSYKAEGSRFCSRECSRESWSVEIEEYKCENCDTTVERKPYNVKGDVVVCSNECFSEFMRSIRKGEDNPVWEGGRFPYYGPNWSEQREKALERDNYECQECGMEVDEHIQEYNRELEVHHKVKRRQIIDEKEPTIEQFELANSLDNLVTVCISCHRKLEGIYNVSRKRKI